MTQQKFKAWSMFLDVIKWKTIQTNSEWCFLHHFETNKLNSHTVHNHSKSYILRFPHEKTSKRKLKNKWRIILCEQIKRWEQSDVSG